MFEKLMTEIFSYLILHKNIYHKPGSVKQAFKPSLLEAEVAPLGVQGHLGLLSKLQATQGYNSETLSKTILVPDSWYAGHMECCFRVC